jgi:hypothetical protein
MPKNISNNVSWGQSRKPTLEHNYSHLSKLDHFINISNICGIDMKSSSFKNRVSKFMQKMFCDIDPWTSVFTLFSHNLRKYYVNITKILL